MFSQVANSAPSNQWGLVLFATLVPMAMGIIAGLIHVVFRLGKLTQKVESLDRRVPEIPYAAVVAAGAAAGAAAGTAAGAVAGADAGSNTPPGGHTPVVGQRMRSTPTP